MTAIVADFINPAFDHLTRSTVGFCIWRFGVMVVGDDGSEFRIVPVNSDNQKKV